MNWNEFRKAYRLQHGPTSIQTLSLAYEKHRQPRSHDLSSLFKIDGQINFHEFPDDLLYEIMLQADYKTVISFGSVDKRGWNICFTKVLWTKLYMRDFADSGV